MKATTNDIHELRPVTVMRAGPLTAPRNAPCNCLQSLSCMPSILARSSEE